MKICQEFNSIQEILDLVLNIYAEANPDRDDELQAMGVYKELDEIAKALDIHAHWVNVRL
jgi:hypothetical protein